MASLTELATRRLGLFLGGTCLVTAIAAGSAGVAIGQHTSGGGSSGKDDGGTGVPSATSQPSPSATVVTVIPSATSAGADNTAAPAGALPGAPSRVNEFGIPVGYPHTEPGAISACGNYVSAYSDVRNREPSRIKAIFSSISLPSVADKFASQIVDIDKKNAGTYAVPSINDPSVNFVSRVLGYKINSASRDTVAIDVWSATSFGIYGSQDPDLQPQTRWGSDACTVQWSNGDWKLSEAGDGPTGPLMTDRPAEDFKQYAFVGGSTSS